MRKGSAKLKLIKTLQIVFSDLLEDLKGDKKRYEYVFVCVCVHHNLNGGLNCLSS